MANQAKEYAARNRAGSDWFSHDSSKKAPVATGAETMEAAHPPPPASAVDAAMPADEPCQDDKPAAADAAPASARAQMIRPKCDSNDWYKYEHNAGEDKGSEAKREKEGAAYCRRDKSGSAAQWFSHEHGGDDAGQQRQRGTGTGSANAARMRNESDCWYNYDKPAATATDSGAGQKKHVANKPGGNEMHGIFHHAAAGN